MDTELTDHLFQVVFSETPMEECWSEEEYFSQPAKQAWETLKDLRQGQ